MIRLLFTLILSYFSLGAYPDVDVRGNKTENYFGLQGRAYIKLNAANYHLGDDIYIDCTIKNFGDEPIRIFPTMIELTTFQFIIKNNDDEVIKAKDIPLPEDYKLEKRNRTVNQVGDRLKEIIIHKGESFTKRLNLTRYYDFEPGNKYFISSYFYPNYTEDKSLFFRSENQVSFLMEKKKEESPLKRIQEEDISNEGISPEEIVHLFLSAEKRKNWNYYFKYIYFPEYILSYDRFASEYSGGDSEYKDVVLDEFKRYLTESRSGKLNYYKINSAKKLDPELAKVYVYVEREQGRFISKFEYQYTLRKMGARGFWKISSLSARVVR